MDGSKSATVQLQLIRAFSVVEKPFLFFDVAALTMLKPQNQNIKKAQIKIQHASQGSRIQHIRLPYCKDCLIKESIFPQKK